MDAHPLPPSWWEKFDGRVAVSPPPLACASSGGDFRVFGSVQPVVPPPPPPGAAVGRRSITARSAALGPLGRSDWMRVAAYLDPCDFALALLSRECRDVLRVAQIKAFMRRLNVALRAKVALLFEELGTQPADCDATLHAVHQIVMSMQDTIARFRPHEAREALIEHRTDALARAETLVAWVRQQLAVAREAKADAEREFAAPPDA